MLKNSVAVVTGGESGIGAACAKALGDAGARVVITYFKDEAAAKAVCASIGGHDRAIAVQTNVGDEGAVEALFAAAEPAFGTVEPAGEFGRAQHDRRRSSSTWSSPSSIV